MTGSETHLVFSHESLLQFTVECFSRAGFEESKALFIAETLIEADLRGLNTHGVIRIPMYLDRVKLGLIDPSAETKVILDQGSFAILDAQNGMGQIASQLAMEMALEKAKSPAVALVGVRNSNHFGAAAYYSMMALEKKAIGICCSNTEPLMPAPGGAKAVVGNNPFSVAIPAKNRLPIVVDMATSAAAIGKIMLAQKRGNSIPPGWATDRFGNDTTDPEKALDGGMLLPVGGPKGYGISIIIDVLAGILMGSGFGEKVKSPLKDLENRQRAGHLFMAINIESFLPVDQFCSHVDDLIDQVKNGPKAAGVKEVFLPGEIEYHTKNRRLKEGIPLPQDLVQQLEAYGKDLGVKSSLREKRLIF